MDPFIVLEISNQSTETEVKRRYKVLALKYHPDKAGKGATAKFQEINEAYETIIEKKLYSDPDKATEEAASQHDGNEPRQEVNSKRRPEPEPAPAHPSTAPPQSPIRPTAQQSPPCAYPQPQSGCPLSPSGDDALLRDFAEIRDVLYGFTCARILCPGRFDHLIDGPEACRSFEDLDDMLEWYESFGQLSRQLGDLIFAIKMLWSNNCDAVSSKFVTAFSFAAIVSVTGIRKQQLLTTRLWRVAENTFDDFESRYERATIARDIRSRMTCEDTWLRGMYDRVCWALYKFLNEEVFKDWHLKYSPRRVYLKYKIPVALRCMQLSNEAGVSWRWLAADVGMIMLIWKEMYRDYHVWDPLSMEHRAVRPYSFDDLAELTRVAGLVDDKAKCWMRTTFNSQKDVRLHPFSNMFIPPKWRFLERALLSHP